MKLGVTISVGDFSNIRYNRLIQKKRIIKDIEQDIDNLHYKYQIRQSELHELKSKINRFREKTEGLKFCPDCQEKLKGFFEKND